MKKSEFLDGLCRGLRFHTDSSEIQHMVDFYSQAIDDRMEDGMTEEEAVAAMGDLDYIIREARNAWDQESAGPASARGSGAESHRTFSPFALEKVDVFDSSGDVRVLPSPDGNIHVEFCPSEDWRYDVDVSGSVLSIRRARNRGVEERMDFDVFGYKFSIPKPCLNGLFNSELHLTLLMPESRPLGVSVNVASGDVKVSDVGLSSLYVKSASGDVDVENVHSGGKVSLITASGDVALEDVSAPEIVVSTVSGDVDAACVNCASLGVKTVSGDMDLRAGPSRRVSLYTVSGDTRLELSAPCADTSAESVSGNIGLRLAGVDGLYTVRTRTRSGRTNYHGAACQGPNIVQVKSLSGDIEIDFGR